MRLRRWLVHRRCRQKARLALTACRRPIAAAVEFLAESLGPFFGVVSSMMTIATRAALRRALIQSAATSIPCPEPAE
jgi:hypothetical protein